MADLSFVKYSFDYLVEQLQNRVKASNTWKSSYRSGTGQMLIEFYAYVGSLVMHTVERAFQEGYIGLAQNRSSIINLVRLLGYVPKRAVSSTGFVTFTMATAKAKNVYIPKYTRVNTANGVAFVVMDDDAKINVGQTTAKKVAIVQGTKVEQVISSSGALNQEYVLNYTDIENSNVIVSVNDIPWTPVDSFTSGSPTSQIYKLRAELDDTVSVIFGDNILAKSPDAGDEIKILFLRSAGKSGNVTAIGSINVISDVIYDIDGTVISDITVANEDAVLGGDDPEDQEEIRSEAPRVFATGDRAVTKSDYVAILDNTAGIASSNAWGENEENPPNYNMFNRVKICIVLQDWLPPSADFKTALAAALYQKAQLTVKYTFVDAVIIEVIPVIDAKITRGYSLSTLETNIPAIVKDQFELGVTTKLGVSKRLADVMNAIENLDGVDYHYLTLDIFKKLVAKFTFTPSNAYGEIMDAIAISRNTARLYLRSAGNDVLLARDNGVGGWTDEGPSYAVTGSINYATGKVGVDIVPAPDPTSTIFVRYNQDERGDVVVTANQICRMQDIEVTLAYSS